jgi:hypothetical protein
MRSYISCANAGETVPVCRASLTLGDGCVVLGLPGVQQWFAQPARKHKQGEIIQIAFNPMNSPKVRPI